MISNEIRKGLESRHDPFLNSKIFYYITLMEIKEEGLKREIGVRALAANSFNLTVGAGIFALPAVVYQMAGTAGIFAYLICGLAMIIIVLCFAEIGSKISTSGGSYIYVETALGPLAGFITNLLVVIGFAIAADAAIANALLDTFAPQLELLDVPIFRAIIFFILFGGIAFINISGTKKAIRLVELNTVVKLIPLLALVAVGIFYIQPKNLVIMQWPSLNQLGEVSLVLFFAFVGADTALGASGEIKNPARTVPLGILVGLFIVLVLYVGIQTVAVGVLGSDIVHHAEAPLAQVGFSIYGQTGITIILVATFLSMFGLLSGDLLASPRIVFAGAKQGMLPKVLASIHPNYKTPYIAIIVYALIAFIFSISGAFRQLAALASASMLSVYLLVCIATIKMRLTEKEKSKGFRLPGGITIPIIGIVIVLWFLSNLARNEWIALLGFIGVCLLYYFSVLWKKLGKRI